jgi:hypothetical protein
MALIICASELKTRSLCSNVEIQRVELILDFAHQGTVRVGTWRKDFLVLVGQHAWSARWVLNLPPCFFAGTQFNATVPYDGPALTRDVVLAVGNDAAGFRSDRALDRQELDYAFINRLAVESYMARNGGSPRPTISAAEASRNYETNATEPCDFAAGKALRMKYAGY